MHLDGFDFIETVQVCVPLRDGRSAIEVDGVRPHFKPANAVLLSAESHGIETERAPAVVSREKRADALPVARLCGARKSVQAIHQGCTTLEESKSAYSHVAAKRPSVCRERQRDH